MTNKSTLRLYNGNRDTKPNDSEVDFEAVNAALYMSVGITGSSSSLSHSLNKEATTCGSSIPF